MMNDLVEKYNYFIENFPFKNKFYHLISIKNFIDNFDKLKNEKDKEEIFSLLNEYMDYITLNEVNSHKECKSLFYDFIAPIGRIYSRNIKFIFLFAPSTIIIYTIIIAAVLCGFKINYLFLSLLFLICIGVIILVYNMRKNGNVYSYNF